MNHHRLEAGPWLPWLLHVGRSEGREEGMDGGREGGMKGGREGGKVSRGALGSPRRGVVPLDLVLICTLLVFQTAFGMTASTGVPRSKETASPLGPP